jgi:hypothetical protein
MILPAGICERLFVVERGEATEPQRELLGEKIRSIVRYADPVAWITATAVARALTNMKDPDALARDCVAVVAISECGPSETMDVVAEAAVAGSSSPLRYPAANPGSLIGVTCIAFGFRGPTLDFIMPPSDAVPLGLVMADAWLKRRAASVVVLATHARRATREHVARCLLLSLKDPSVISRDALDKETILWLSFGND